jgi:hypothetical protein
VGQTLGKQVIYYSHYSEVQTSEMLRDVWMCAEVVVAAASTSQNTYTVVVRKRYV